MFGLALLFFKFPYHLFHDGIEWDFPPCRCQPYHLSSGWRLIFQLRWRLFFLLFSSRLGRSWLIQFCQCFHGAVSRPHPVRLGISPEMSGRFSIATIRSTSSCSPLKRTFISSSNSSIFSVKSMRIGITFAALMLCQVFIKQTRLVHYVARIADVLF